MRRYVRILKPLMAPAIIAIFLSLSVNVSAQLIVYDTLTAQQLVQEVLVGSGVSASNITYVGHDSAKGAFYNGSSTLLDLDHGVILSSGFAKEASGPVGFFATTGNGTPGDPDLEALIGSNTNDAAVLEFDFVPQSDTIRFNYVFGSEEYPEYVCSSFNDVFGFFIWGTNPATGLNYGGQNIAIIPGADPPLPVAINSVNNGSVGAFGSPGNCISLEYASLYIDNQAIGGLYIAYDGFTVVLTAELIVIPCETYHIKLAVGDAGDSSYDSGVFLEANSFSAKGLNTSVGFSQSSETFGATVEGCNNATITFELVDTQPDDYVINFTIMGTAINGVDYVTIPDSIVIPAGSLSDSIIIEPILDTLVEPTERIYLLMSYESACNNELDTLMIRIFDYSMDFVGLDTLHCETDIPDTLSGYPVGGIYSGNGVTGNIFDPSQANYGLNQVSYTYYYLDETQIPADTICSNMLTKNVWVMAQSDVEAGSDESICQNDPYDFSGASTLPTGLNYDSLFWTTTGSGTISDPTTLLPTYYPSLDELGDVIFTLTGYSPSPCYDDTSLMVLTIDTLPVAGFTTTPLDTCCVGELIAMDGYANCVINTWAWDFGDSNVDTGQNVTHAYTAPGEYTVALTVFNNYNCIDTVYYQKVVVEVNINFSMTNSPTCVNHNVDFTGSGDASFTDWLWNFGDGNTAIGKVVNHTYTTPGTYYVTLDVCSEQVLDSIIVHPLPVNDAGSDEATCEDVWFDFSTSTIPPAATDYGSILWYGGTGTFDDPTAVTPIYTPGPGELGLVTLTMVAYGLSPCENDTSQMTLNVIEGAYAQAGSDENTCIDEPFDFASSSFVPFATNWDTLYWSGGAGSFIDPNVEVPVYIPAPGEVGPITLTMVASGFIVNCDSVDEMTLTIRPEHLTPVDTTICYLDSVLAQGNWQFASGTFYDTLLSVFDCDSVIQTNLTVRPEIDYDFTTGPGDSICEGESISFSQSGSSTITSFLWDFGDGQTSTSQNPTHQYNFAGNYEVILSYTDNNGCSDEKVHPVGVFPYPDVDFVSSMTSACINAQVNFNGFSSANIVSWDWDFGDGQTGTGQNISHVYQTFGLFEVSLNVTSDNGCDSVAYHNVYISPPPTADFEYYVVQCDTIQFVDLTIKPPGYNLVGWAWDFGDGGTSVLQNPWHVYDSSGVILVTLIVTADSAGLLCNDTITKPITVPARPTVYFTWDPEPTCLGNPTSFFGTSGNSIAGWYWDFGDGNFATIQEPVHMYTYADSFNVILAVTDMNGCTDTVMHTVTVIEGPDVDFTVNPNPACQDNQTSFSGISSGNIINWSWDFGDGGVGTGQHTTHTYAITGTFTVVLTVTDSSGCTNNISYPVSVSPPPTANFTSSSPACSADSIFFLNYSTTPNGYIQEWEWDFGDGTIVTIQYPSDPDIAHLYAGGGTYTVTLTILDSDSCTDFFSQDVVIEASPIADFNNTPGCQGEAVVFTDLSSPNSGSTIVSWFWEFDDPASGSNTSTQQHPTHLFSGSGTYDVILVIHNVAGCADTLIKAVDVNELPAVDFTMSTDTVCINEEITFTSIAPTASNYLWDFGDGGTSVLRDPVYVYTTDGVFTVTLTVTDGNSCENSMSHDVVVDPLPWAAYSNSAPACTSTPVYFTDLSSAVSGFLTEWHWYFGDGTDTIVYYPDDPDVHHSYATAGDYTAILAVTSSAGCVDSVSQDLTILQGPEALFGYEGSNCQGSTMQFNDMSNAFGSTIGSWQWNFGDPSSGANNTSNLQNPTHVFDTAGTYTVTLQVTITEGCYDVLTQDITIAPPPPVYYYTDPPSSCFTDVTYFYTDPDSTNIAEVASYLWDFDDPASGANNLSTLQDPTHVFTTPGTYSVTLTITDINGCENMITRQVSVTNKPTADYSYELPCLADATQFFDGSLSGGAPVTSWFWDFDDPATAPNNTSNLQDPRHMFSAMGTYTVMLIAMDINGCMDTSYKTIDVSDSPTSAFMFQQACDPPGTVFFTDSSFMGTGGQPIVAWKWELEPGYFSSEVNPQYTYNYTDSCYQVNLTVTDEHGCENTTTREVCVNDPLSVSFTGNDVCMGESERTSPRAICQAPTASFSGAGTLVMAQRCTTPRMILSAILIARRALTW